MKYHNNIIIATIPTVQCMGGTRVASMHDTALFACFPNNSPEFNVSSYNMALRMIFI